MKPTKCCIDYINSDYNYCPYCGSRLLYTRIVVDSIERKYNNELWNHIYDYTINGQNNIDRDYINNEINKYDQLNEDELNQFDLDEFCDYCFENTIEDFQ